MPSKFQLHRFWPPIFFVFILSYANSLLSQHYMWPTDASRLMTSSFCEFRPRHFHAAIDIKTWNRTGYKVLAIDGGYVVRVRVGAFGYGRAIYLKLADGNIVVYGHMERFWPALENYVNRYRMEHRQYNVDLHLTASQFPVKRGQYLGRTGKTGIGVPHLHLELRNSRNEPMNPLPFYKKVIEDDMPPILYQAALIPLDRASLINLHSDTCFIDLHQESQIALPDTFYLHGKIGLALKVWDHADGARNRFSFYRAKTWIDDSLVYSVKYDTFSYAQTALIELDKDFSLWRKGLGIFHNFFRDPVNTLPFYGKTPPGGGIIDCDRLPEGYHHLRVEIEDFWQNRSEFEMNFVSGKTFALDYDLNKWLANDLFLRIQSPRPLAKFRVKAQGNHGGWHPVPAVHMMGELEYDSTYMYALSVSPEPGKQNRPVRLEGITASGNRSVPLYIPAESGMENRDSEQVMQILHQRMKKDWIELTVVVNRGKPFRLLNHLRHEYPGFFWLPLDSRRFRINLPVAELNQNRNFWTDLMGSQLPEALDVRRGKRQILHSSDNLFQADFPPGALYGEAAVYLKKNDSSENVYLVPPPYQKIGDTYNLQPFDVPVKNGVRVSLTIPDSTLSVKGLGLYYWDMKHGWTFIPSQWDETHRSFSARVTSLELFTLVRDTIPPIILPAQKFENHMLASHKGYLTFVLKDEMSGIQRESQIRVEVNGKWHLFDYDPEENIIFFRIPARKSGTAEVRISVVDNSGNAAEKTYIAR